MPEKILEPDLPIIDPHHHLWDLRPLLEMFPKPHHKFLQGLALKSDYTLNGFLADIGSGHNILGTVFMECRAFYNADVEEAIQPVGEVEFANGIAAQSASGLYGNTRLCAGIIGHADLTLGDAAAPVLEALVAAGNGRFRGIRHHGAWDADPDVLGPPFDAPQGLFALPEFREGFAHLGKMGLTFDAWLLEPQLHDVIGLAQTFPDQPICLNHCGTPVNIASHSGKLEENFPRWQANIRELAQCENVTIKLGGLGMVTCGMPDIGPAAGYGSQALAEMWRPYLETCIEAFGPDRAMFESNFPVDHWAAEYDVLWNTFKRVAAGASAAEKAALFAGTAARFYGLEKILLS